MATITVSDIVAQGDLVANELDQYQLRLDNIQVELDELYTTNPLPSDADEIFNSIKARRDLISDEFNSWTGRQTLNSLRAQASEDVQNDPAVVEIFNNVVNPKNSAVVQLGKRQRTSEDPNIASLVTVKKKIEDSKAGTPPNPGEPSQPPPPGGGGPPEDGGRDTLPTPPTDGSKPGRRQKNPLGWFSSYTYQISLYMCSPQGYNAFVDGGKKSLPPDGQYVLVAQSGGMDKTKRAPSMPYDYYIDNLRMNAAVSLSANGSETLTTNVDFQIMEPYSFSLPTKLKQAGEELVKRNAGSVNAGDIAKLNNQTKQTFIIGIRFFGYDSEGNLMSAANKYDGATLDPAFNATSSQGLFERFFDIRLSSFKFRMEGKAVTYDIKGAVITSSVGGGIQYATLTNPLTCQGKDVKEMLDDLFEKLNKEQKKEKDNKNFLQEINYSYVKDIPGFDEILVASMLNPEDVEKFQWPYSEPENTNAVNPKLADRNGGTPSDTQKTIKFDKGQSILHVINKIIMQSSYLRNALNTVYKNKLAPDALNPNNNENKPSTRKTFRWYNCSPELYNSRWDSKRAAWAYDIRYIIKPYDTPIVQSAYAAVLPEYPGAFKRYDYWYTGENSEIISYTQEYNNAFFTVTLDPGNSVNGQGQGGATDTAQVPGQPVLADTQGANDKGLQAQANAVTSIKDPGAFATAKITIFGDPDFLMQTSETSKDIAQTFRKYFGPDGYSINPTSGQVFIEVNFNEPIDYDTDKGYMKINREIIFWEYPDNIKSIVKGVSYRVNRVRSTFSSGKFTQVLECTLNTFKDATPRPEPAQQPPPPGPDR